MPPPIPLPSKLMEWSMEFWRKVLLESEQSRREQVDSPAPGDPETVRRRDKDAPPDIW